MTAALVLLIAACSKSPEPAPPAAPAAATAPAAAAPAWTPPPIGRCDNVALLTQYSFSALADGKYCELCKDVDEGACEYDWPTNDVPSCALWDELRNGIYAYYGRPFDSERWKQYFAKKTWYKADPGFDESRLSEVARANVAFLKARGEAKEGCMD